MLFYGQKLLVDGVCSVHRAVLSQIAQSPALGQGDSAGVRGHFTYYDAQQSGLAGPVDAHYGSLFIIFYMKADIFQHFLF